MRETLKNISNKIKRETTLYRKAMSHPRTPRSAKMLLGLALGYLALPFDLIPDFIPLLGALDDLVVVPGLVYLALKRIPDEVIQEIESELEKSE